jgi:hypothetical protein
MAIPEGGMRIGGFLGFHGIKSGVLCILLLTGVRCKSRAFQFFVVSYMINDSVRQPTDPPCCSTKDRCAPIQLLVDNSGKRRAFATLLMMGDDFLPGIVLLGYRLRELCPDVDRVCMVTDDVSTNARGAIEAIYTKIVYVPYIFASKSALSAQQDARKRTYANSFTKFHALALEDYDIVAFLDADVLPVRGMKHLFDVPTPAALYWGCAHPWTSERQQRDYVDRICKRKLRHGAKVDWEFQSSERAACKKEKRVYYGMETSIFVCSPDRAQFDKLLRLMKNIERARKQLFLLKGDSTLLGYFWAKELHMLDPRFLVRNPSREQMEHAFVIDMFGPRQKPWHVALHGNTENWRPWARVAWLNAYYRMAHEEPGIVTHHELLGDVLRAIEKMAKKEA